MNDEQSQVVLGKVPTWLQLPRLPSALIDALWTELTAPPPVFVVLPATEYMKPS